jgi:endonuclease YncB( thermonuclease family)
MRWPFRFDRPAARLRRGIVLAALAWGCVAPPARAASACDGPGPYGGRIAAVDSRLEFSLEDGTRLLVAGIDPARPTPDDPDRDSAGQAAAAAAFVGATVTFRPLATQPDRWRRIPALVYAATPGGEGSSLVAATLVGSGLARYRPDPAAANCLHPLRAIEDAARAARLGLWADPYYAVLSSTDHDGFTERAGSVVLAEGVLREVRAGGFRTLLLFEPRSRGRQTLAVTVLQRKVASFEAAGLGFRALIGRRLRVRGLLETRFGPHIEIESPEDLDLLPPSTPKATDLAAPSVAPR